MLSEINQEKHHIISLKCRIQGGKNKIIDSENGLVVVRHRTASEGGEGIKR